MLKAVPWAITLAVFLLLYRFVLNCKTYWRYVWTGAVVATILFEASKGIFMWYLVNVANYELIYGSVAGSSYSRIALVKSAPTTPLRLAPDRLAPPRLAPECGALDRSAPIRLASVRLAPVRLALVKLGRLRLASVRSAARRPTYKKAPDTNQEPLSIHSAMIHLRDQNGPVFPKPRATSAISAA